MTAGPRIRSGVASAPDYLAKVRAAWGDPSPDWIEALAAECQRSSQKAVAQRLGYSASVVSQALVGAYRGDVDRFEEVVRGAYMAATVDCRIFGEIGRDRCLQEQREPFRASSAHRAQVYHECNTPGRCLHSTATANASATTASGDQS